MAGFVSNRLLVSIPYSGNGLSLCVVSMHRWSKVMLQNFWLEKIASFVVWTCSETLNAWQRNASAEEIVCSTKYSHQRLAPKEIQDSLLNAAQLGKKQLDSFVADRLCATHCFQRGWKRSQHEANSKAWANANHDFTRWEINLFEPDQQQVWWIA